MSLKSLINSGKCNSVFNPLNPLDTGLMFRETWDMETDSADVLEQREEIYFA
jgi:hypothetical protein